MVHFRRRDDANLASGPMDHPFALGEVVDVVAAPGKVVPPG